EILGVFSRSRGIRVNLSVLGSEIQGVADAVLTHEGQHAFDLVMYGPTTSAAGCYMREVRAFTSEANFWAAAFGPAGKADFSTNQEAQLNFLLAQVRLDQAGFVQQLVSQYQDECG